MSAASRCLSERQPELERAPCCRGAIRAPLQRFLLPPANGAEALYAANAEGHPRRRCCQPPGDYEDDAALANIARDDSAPLMRYADILHSVTAYPPNVGDRPPRRRQL